MIRPNIRPLIQTEFPQAVRLLGVLNPETPMAVISQRLDEILAHHSNYQLHGAFEGEILIGLCSAWIATKIWCGRYLEIDNMVVDPDRRSAGVGGQLIQYMENLARAEGCKIVVLDSYTSNHGSHRLYHRHGLEIWGFHFIKPIGDWSGKGVLV